MTPLPPHIPGIVRVVPLDRPIEYYRLNRLQAASGEANAGADVAGDREESRTR
jgi:hypothetical protein